MKRLGLAAALLVFASTAQGQGGSVSASCSSATPAETRDACQKATDIFRYLSPQLGATIAGGNTIMGSGGVLGGLPHWTVGIRGTVISGSLPEFTTANAPGTGAPAASAYTTKTQILGFPAVDAALGVYGGFPLGLTKIGGIDLLANAAYVPSIDADNISITPETNIQIGYGARIGLLQESLLVPGVSVSMMQRGLPKTTITSFTTAGSSTTDTLQIKDLDLKTTSYRLTVSKSLILFGFAAGVGMDKYKSSTDVNVALHRTLPVIGAQRFGNSPTTPFKVDAEMTRTNMFLDAYLNILLVKIVGEVGMVRGGEMTTFNTFDKLPNASRPYGAVGVRVGF